MRRRWMLALCLICVGMMIGYSQPVHDSSIGPLRTRPVRGTGAGGSVAPPDSFLLKEDGEYLLLESSKIVQETGAEPDNPPNTLPPDDFDAEFGGERQASLSWVNKSTGAYTTVIEKASDHKNFRRVVEVASGVTTYVDPGVEYDLPWTYRGKASSAAGHSKSSDEADITINSLSITDLAVTVLVTGNVGGGDWHGRASMVELGDGTWVMCWRTGSAHQVNDGQLHIKFSDDYGDTWTATDTDLDGDPVTGFPMWPPGGAPGDASGPGEPYLYLADDGTLILHMWLVDYNVSIGGTYQSTSADGGKTWTTPAAVVDFGGIVDDTEVFSTDDHFVYGGVIYAGARVWVTSVIPNDPAQMILIKSEDDGATWEKVSVIMDSNEGEDATGGQEVGIEYLGSNTIIAIIRDSDHNHSYKRISTDMGATWGALTTYTSPYNSPGVSGRHRIHTEKHLKGQANWWNDDVLIMTGFVHAEIGASQTRINAVWVTRDQGDTWHPVLALDAVYDDAGYGEILYDPTEDKFVVVSYRGTVNAAALVQYKFTIDGL